MKRSATIASSPSRTLDREAKGVVSMVGKGLKLVPKFGSDSIHTLYLGNNNIEVLDGIEKFTELKKLSLAFNNIDSIKELRKLPSGIEVITLEGNPVASFVNYFHKVVLLLPLLKVLDGTRIRPEDRAIAKSTLNKENELLSLIIEEQGKLMPDATLEQISEAAEKRVETKFRRQRVSWEEAFSSVLLELKGQIVASRENAQPTFTSQIKFDAEEMPRIVQPRPHPALINYKEENTELKKKLFEAKAVNEKNISRARKEIGELSVKAKNVAEDGIRLKEILFATLNKIQHITSAKDEQEICRKYERIGKELKAERAVKLYRRKALFKALSYLKNAATLLKKENSIKARKRRRLLHISLHALRQVLLIEKFRTHLITKRAILRVLDFFKKWRRRRNAEIKAKMHIYKQLCYKSLQILKKYSTLKKLRRGKLAISCQFWSRKTQRKIMQVFTMSLIPSEVTKGQQITIVKQNHETRLVRAVLNALMEIMKKRLNVRKCLNQAFSRHQYILKSKSIWSIKLFVKRIKSMEKTIGSKKRKRFIKAFFSLWTKKYNCRFQQKALKRLVKLHYLKRWERIAVHIKLWSHKMKLGANWYTKRLKKRTLSGLKTSKNKRRQLRIISKTVRSLKNQRIRRESYNYWALAYDAYSKQRKLAMYSIKRKCFKNWNTVSQRHRQKRIKNKLAQKWRNRLLRELLKNIYKKWQGIVFRNKWKACSIQNILVKRQHHIKRVYISKLREMTVKAIVSEYKHYVSTIETEERKEASMNTLVKEAERYGKHLKGELKAENERLEHSLNKLENTAKEEIEVNSRLERIGSWEKSLLNSYKIKQGQINMVRSELANIEKEINNREGIYKTEREKLKSEAINLRNHLYEIEVNEPISKLMNKLQTKDKEDEVLYKQKLKDAQERLKNSLAEKEQRINEVKMKLEAVAYEQKVKKKEESEFMKTHNLTKLGEKAKNTVRDRLYQLKQSCFYNTIHIS